MRRISRRQSLQVLGTTALGLATLPSHVQADTTHLGNGPGKLLAGKWTYRSFLRDPDLNRPFNDLKFAAAVLQIDEAAFGEFKGRLIFDEDGLALRGTVTYGNPFTLRFQGTGDTEGTKGWLYDYLGYLSLAWPNGVHERPALIGTIVRTVPHSEGKAKAGVVASWIAVKQG